MTSPSEALQIAVLNALLADEAVAAIVGDRILDGTRPQVFPCITFGPRDYVSEDYDCFPSRVESLQLDCWTREGGKTWGAAALCDAVKAALHLKELDLDGHALTLLRVEAVRVFLDSDSQTAHGVVTLEAEIEER